MQAYCRQLEQQLGRARQELEKLQQVCEPGGVCACACAGIVAGTTTSRGAAAAPHSANIASTCKPKLTGVLVQENKALQTKAVVLSRHTSFRRSAAQIAEGLTVRVCPACCAVL